MGGYAGGFYAGDDDSGGDVADGGIGSSAGLLFVTTLLWGRWAQAGKERWSVTVLFACFWIP